jgi:hypothetical protein
METKESEIIHGISDQFRQILSSSEQSVYIYLDDIHKVCNNRFATLLGYSSPEEWARVANNFPEAFVEPESQETLVAHYQKAMDKLIGAEFPVTWKKKPGGKVKTSVILVPIIYSGKKLSLHYITELK